MTKKKKLTKPQLEILFDCWKNGNNTKEWLELIVNRLPKVQSLLALSIMRKMAKTDEQWIKAATKKKNKLEKEKREKFIEKEKKKVAASQRKQEREKKCQIKKEKQAEKIVRQNLYEKLTLSVVKQLEEKIKPEFFFCTEAQQYINNIACIFRLFSKEFVEIVPSYCSNCKKMNCYISTIEEIINEKIGIINQVEIKKKRGRPKKIHNSDV